MAFAICNNPRKALATFVLIPKRKLQLGLLALVKVQFHLVYA